MIEIKKPASATPGTTSVLTETVDLVAKGCDFTQLNTNPFTLLQGIPGKTIIPFIVTCSYYSTGSLVNGFTIQSDLLPYYTPNSLFAFCAGVGVLPDQSGVVTFNIYGNAPFTTQNNAENGGLLLYTQNDDIAAAFNKCIMSITYYLIDNL
jgi:hypothetical protein